MELISTRPQVPPCRSRNSRMSEIGTNWSSLTPISVVGSTPFVLVVNPAKVPARNAKELQAFLKQNGIASEVYYPLPPHLSTPCRKFGYKEGDFPHAELASRQTLALPLYPELTVAQQDEVSAAVREFVS